MFVPHQPQATTDTTACHDATVDRVARFLFGTPGDFFERHQGVTLAIVVVMLLLGSAL